MRTPATKLDEIQYQLAVARRQAYDALLWQTPVLSLTAQAFLFSIALTAGNSIVARVLSALLALLTSLASMHLMAKHRHYERATTTLLQEYEKHNSLLPLHEQLNTADAQWYLRLSAFRLWLLVLGLFAVASAFVLSVEALSLGWLNTPKT